MANPCFFTCRIVNLGKIVDKFANKYYYINSY